MTRVRTSTELTESYLENTKAHLDTIDQKFTEIFEKYGEIGTLLNEFKKKLGVDEKTDLPMCFLRLRECVGNYNKLELSENRPLSIVVEEGADKTAKEVVEVFNQVLRLCDEFPSERDAAEEFIREKRQMVQSESVQTQSTLEALEHSGKQLEEMRRLSQLIKNLNNDIIVAKTSLESMKRVTGQIQVAVPPQ